MHLHSLCSVWTPNAFGSRFILTELSFIVKHVDLTTVYVFFLLSWSVQCSEGALSEIYSTVPVVLKLGSRDPQGSLEGLYMDLWLSGSVTLRVYIYSANHNNHCGSICIFKSCGVLELNEVWEPLLYTCLYSFNTYFATVYRHLISSQASRMNL